MWRPLTSTEGDDKTRAPCSRCKHAAVLLDGEVYVLGGRGAGGAVPLRDFWRYTLATGQWKQLDCLGQAPPSLQEHSAVAHGNKLYVFGGEAGAQAGEIPLWVYDTHTHIWRKLAGSRKSVGRGGGLAGTPGGPGGRRGHSAHALNDCMLVFGGYKDLRGSTNELWAFNYESECWQQVRTATPGPARHRHAAALHGTRLYVHGGQKDLRDCGDLWHFDTMSRQWRSVRPRGPGPGALRGHAAARAGAHLYIFGGERDGRPNNELWRFHFASETWERIMATANWPSPRVDSAALLVAAELSSTPVPPATTHATVQPPPAGFLRDLAALSSLRRRRANRCSYTALGEHDSTESLPPPAAPLPKSHSAGIITREGNPKEADEAESDHELAHDPISVPNFADMVLPTPVLSPTQITKLVYLDSEDEDEKRAMTRLPDRVDILPKSASVRFAKETVTTTEDEAEMSTSDYASAERVNRLSGTSSLGFCNPHYLGPDVRKLGTALTPDSGVGPTDIELQDMSRKFPPKPTQLHLLLIGGKEPPHVARLQSPLSMWTYRLL